MEQHPVPRNITGFQFRLIGNMTLKQFGYLLSGGILAVIFIKLPFPPFIGWPIGIGCFLTGIAFAFLPIQERPLDRWFVAFIRSIYSPTQFIWHKQNPPPAILLTPVTQHLQDKTKHSSQYAKHYEQSRKKLKAYLNTLPKSPHETVDKEEKKQLRSLISLFGQSSDSLTTPTIPTAPQVSLKKQKSVSSKKAPIEKKDKLKPTTTIEEKIQLVTKPARRIEEKGREQKQPKLQKVPQQKSVKIRERAGSVDDITGRTQKLTGQITDLKKELSKKEINKQRVHELEQQLNQLLTEKDGLMKELVELRKELSDKDKGEIVRPTTFKEEKKGQETVKIISSKIAKQEGFPSIPQVPNIISGIIKNREGNLLPNILVTIKDKDDTPVRALKTNKLGQFTASTPLSSDVYTIECEDPQKKYSFAIIEITLTGNLVTPLEIIAKSEKDLHREKLMKEIFGEGY